MERARFISEAYIADFFKVNTEDAKDIYRKLRPVVFENGTNIVTVGEQADGLFFIDDGTVLVYNGEGEIVNEMRAGQYFGEYAILAGETRLTTVTAKGKVVVYRMENEDFLQVVANHPHVVGRLLKQVYGQLSMKHTKLLSISKKRRGLIKPKENPDGQRTVKLILTYVAVALFILLASVFCPEAEQMTLGWAILPLAFLIGFTLFTKRIVEGLFLGVLMCCGMLYGPGLFEGFVEATIEEFGNEDMAVTLVIMALISVMTCLLSRAGAVSAFKRRAERRIKTGRGALFAMFGILVLEFVDECLNVISAAFSTIPVTDRHKVPREVPALMGSFATAICAMVPLSIWGAYLSGMVSGYTENGGLTFLEAVPFNFISILCILAAVLLAAGKLPQTRQIKRAYERVEQGKALWPENSEQYFLSSDEEINSHPGNLIAPLVVLVVSSIGYGIYENDGHFGLNMPVGLVITLFFMFALYCFRRVMTPNEYFEYFGQGIEEALMPIILLAFTQMFSMLLEKLQFTDMLVDILPDLSGHFVFLLPAIMFVVFTLMAMGTGCSWGMYGIGLPVAIHLAMALQMNVPLCIGVIFAAGIAGESLCPYIDENCVVVSAVGIEPKAYRKLRMEYWFVLSLISTACYAAAGYITMI